MEATDGDDHLVISNRGGSSSLQVQYIAAPVNAEGSEIAIPVAATDAARLRFSLETTSVGTVAPFTAFGLAGFDSTDPATTPPFGTGFFEDKLIAQLNDAGTQVVLKGGIDTPGVPGADLAVLPTTVSLPDTFELQLTADSARILQNDVPLTGVQTDAQGWVAHGLNLADFDGDSLTPFLGVIRGAGQFGGTTAITGAGFDDINAGNIVIPEPASLSLLAVASVAALHRGRRRRRHA